MISPNYFLDDYKSAEVQFFLTHQKVKYNVSVTYIVGQTDMYILLIIKGSRFDWTGVCKPLLYRRFYGRRNWENAKKRTYTNNQIPITI